MTGISMKNVTVHGTYLGGGFGRRLEADFVVEVVEIAQKVKAPVHLIWTREEDMKNDYFRPLAVANMEAHFNDKNEFALDVDLGTQNLAEREFEDWAPGLFPALSEGMSKSIGSLIGKISSGQFAKEGLVNSDYAFENFDYKWSEIETNIPGGSWRSVGHSITGFFVESIVDEIAHKLKQDPIAFRKKYLAKSPRHIAVLNEVEKMSGWGKRKLPKGHSLGVAVHKSFGSVVAEVAEVSLEGGTIKVHNVYCAGHCGTAVNPDGIKAQMEGGVIFALSAALFGEITYDKGQVEQSNFHDYQVVRMSESPDIQVKIIKSNDKPTGVGEPGVPPLAAAVANALFTASGKRVRQLPLQKHLV